MSRMYKVTFGIDFEFPNDFIKSGWQEYFHDLTAYVDAESEKEAEDYVRENTPEFADDFFAKPMEYSEYCKEKELFDGLQYIRGSKERYNDVKATLIDNYPNATGFDEHLFMADNCIYLVDNGDVRCLIATSLLGRLVIANGTEIKIAK